MKGWIRKTWMGCVVALALGAGVAHADGGTITFSGAIIEPTCAAQSGSLVATSSMQGARVAVAQRFGCGAVGSSGSVAHASPSSYTLTVEALESSSLSTDRLVSYFAGYSKAAGQDVGAMNLVTQAYE